MARITYFLRKRREGANFSLEQVFENLALRTSKNYDVNQTICPYVSSGLIKRILNVLSAPFHQGDINHVTGDINYIVLLLKKRKTISTILDLGVLQQTSGFKRKAILTIWFKWSVSRSKWVTVISEATKQDLLKNVNCDPEKIKVIYVPISESFKRVDKIFNSECPTIMQIGAAPNKNLKGLIAAVNGINCKLLIIGKISEENLQLLKDGNIQYENKVAIPFQEIIESYISADILFFASTFEGFGMPILEAQAVGRPVITSNILSMPEVGGDASIYVDPYNIEEIRNSIIKLIDNDVLRQRLIERGFENVKRFDADRIASQYDVLYQNILQNN
jgi:glycosyltransferase involved in cell wall biosynthesis